MTAWQSPNNIWVIVDEELEFSNVQTITSEYPNSGYAGAGIFNYSITDTLTDLEIRASNNVSQFSDTRPIFRYDMVVNGEVFDPISSFQMSRTDELVIELVPVPGEDSGIYTIVDNVQTGNFEILVETKDVFQVEFVSDGFAFHALEINVLDPIEAFLDEFIILENGVGSAQIFAKGSSPTIWFAPVPGLNINLENGVFNIEDPNYDSGDQTNTDIIITVNNQVSEVVLLSHLIYADSGIDSDLDACQKLTPTIWGISLQTHELTRSSELLLDPKIHYADVCLENSENFVEYEWNIVMGSCIGNDYSDQIDLTSVVSDQKTFLVPPLFLELGEHCIKFSAFYENSDRRAEYTKTIRVQPSELQALILGGSKRSIDAQKTVYITAQFSFDPDDPDNRNDLEFLWTCGRLDENFQPIVELEPAGCPESDQMTAATITTPDLLANEEYMFSVTVSKPGKISANDSQIIQTHSSKLMSVGVICKSCLEQTNFKISSSKRLTFEAYINNTDLSSRVDDVHFNWIVSEVDDIMNHLDLEDISVSSTGNGNKNLVINEWILKEGVNYVVEVAIEENDMIIGDSQVQIDASSPPNPKFGDCFLDLLTDNSTAAFETSVGFTCYSWQGDVPFTYSLFEMEVMNQKL